MLRHKLFTKSFEYNEFLIFKRPFVPFAFKAKKLLRLLDKFAFTLIKTASCYVLNIRFKLYSKLLYTSKGDLSQI